MISIIIPAYNEEHRIRKTIDRYLDHFCSGTELIIVLNGCVDGTESVVRSLMNSFPGRIRMEVLSEAGKGLAVQRGFTTARGDVIGFVDADGSTSPQEYQKILSSIAGNDGAIGSRWIPGAIVRNRTTSRMFVSRLFVTIERLLFGLPYHDTQCGAKAFNRKPLLDILPRLRVANMAFDVELLWWFRKRGYRVAEIPTLWEDQSSSVVLGSPFKVIVRGIGMLWTLTQLRFRLIFARHTYGSGT